MHDARPVSLISRQTIEALSAETNLTLDHRRFRANFVVDWDSTGPFYEDSLVGRRVRIGDVLEVMVVKNDARCNRDYARSRHRRGVARSACKRSPNTTPVARASTAPCCARESFDLATGFL